MAATTFSSVKPVATGTKMSPIGTVKSIAGLVTATDATGFTRTLQEGDPVFASDVIQTSAAGAVLVVFSDGTHLDLGRNASSTLDQEVFNPDRAGRESADIEAAQARIAAGADPTQVTEAAAAGADAGSEGGASFVVIDQAAPQGLVSSGFPTGGIAVSFGQPAADRVVATPAAAPATPPPDVPPPEVIVIVAPPTGLPYPGGSSDPGDPSLPHVSGNNLYLPEGTNGPNLYNTVTFVLQLSAAHTEDIVIHYTIQPGTAHPVDGAVNSADDDYTGILSGTVLIPAGSTEVPVTVHLIPDHYDEGPDTLAGAQSFSITLDGVETANATISPTAHTAVAWIVDDDTTPVASPDTNWATAAANSISGDVVAGMAHPGDPSATTDFADIRDSDEDGSAPLRVTEVNGDAAKVGTAVTGTYGTLLLNAGGNYTYTLADPAGLAQLDDGETLTDSFTYTLSDAYNTPQHTTLTITIFGANGAPQVTVNADGVGDTVGEAGLATGSAAAGDGEAAAGSFTLADSDGLDDLTSVSLNGGAALPLADLVGSSFDTGRGTVTVTGYDAGSGELRYGYVLGSAQDHSAGPVTDSFTLSVSDGSTWSDPAAVSLAIADDVPNAVDDGNSVGADSPGASGNVLANDLHANGQPGADGRSFDAWTGTTAHYGSFTGNGDGSYVYQLASDNPAVLSLDAGESLSETFAYAIVDADGDPAHATLTITINGANDAPTISISGGTHEVYESGLTPGSGLAPTTTVVSGSFTLDDSDGRDDLTDVRIGSTSFTMAQLAAASADSPLLAASTDAGRLTITGYDGTTGAVSYRYELIHATDQDTTSLDSFTASVSDDNGATYSGPATIAVTIHDDIPQLCSIQDAVLANTDGTVTGAIDVNFGADGAAADGLRIVSYTDLAGVEELISADGQTLTASVDSDGDGSYETRFYQLTLNDAETSYTFEHTARPVSTFALDFSRANGGAGAETLDVPTALNEYTVRFNGGLFNGTTLVDLGEPPPNADNNDDVKPTGTGFGIGNNSAQTTIEDNEGFFVTVREAGSPDFADPINLFSFSVQRNGGNGSDDNHQLTVNWIAYADEAGNDVVGSGTQALTLSGNQINYPVQISPDEAFVKLAVWFTDIQASDGNIRIENFALGTQVIPENEPLQFGIAATDGDGDVTSADQLDIFLQGGRGPDYELSAQGSTVNAILVGGDGNDLMTGDAGNNVLTGGSGDDILTGNGGSDTFVFNADSFATPGNDTVTDFVLGKTAANPDADVLKIGDVLTGAHASDINIPADLSTAAAGGFLKVETVDATTARIVLDLDGSSSGTNAVPIVTLENLTGGFDAATLLSTLLGNDQLK